MRIEQLRHVVEIARCGSMRQAALNLYISQPNLSVSIQNLEEEVGYQIFTRSSRGMQLTKAGKAFVDYAAPVVSQFERLTNLKQDIGQLQSNYFSVAILPYRYLTEAAIQLYNRHLATPIHLSLMDGDRSSIIEMVANNEVELGVLGIFSPFYEEMVRQLEEKELRFVRLDQIKVCALIGKAHPQFYSENDYITCEELRGKTFVGFDEMESGPFSPLPDILGLGNEVCPHRIYAKSWSIILDIVRSTDSFSIVATNRKAYTTIPYYDGVRSLELLDCDCYNIMGWITRKNAVLSDLAMEFLSILSSYF